MKKNNERWLNLGCGVHLSEDFVNVDNFFDLEDLIDGQKTKKGAYQNARVPKDVEFVRADMRALPFEDDSFDYVESEDAIEHMAMKDVLPALKEMYRVLKPGCALGIGTTNFDELAKLWTLNVTGKSMSTQVEMDTYITLSQVIYGNQAGDGEFHRSAFNPFILGYLLQSAGFKLDNIKINIYPTNSQIVDVPQRAYKSIEKKLKSGFILTEMMFAIATK